MVISVQEPVQTLQLRTFMADNSPSPSENPAPPPVRRHVNTWIIPLITVVLVIAAVAGGLYLQSIHFPGEEGLPSPSGAVEGGDAIYARYCATCHGDQGQGRGMFPPVLHTDWVEGDKERLILVTLHGLTGPIEVRGEVYDFDYGMPAFAGRLSDDDIADLLTFMRTSWGNEASPITAEEVARLREEHRDRSIPWRAEQL